MIARLGRLVFDIANKWLFKGGPGRMSGGLGKSPQNSQVRGAFQVEHPARLFRLVILFKTNFFQRLDHLLTAVIDPVWCTDKGNYHIAVGGFV